MDALEFLRSHEHKSDNSFIKEESLVLENWDWLRYSFAVAIKVKSRMQELGITQKQLAEVLGCSQQNVSVILNGRVNLTIETIAKLEKALKFDLIGDYLTYFPMHSEPAAGHAYLNEPGPEEEDSHISTKHLVDGYPVRRKKGPKAK